MVGSVCCALILRICTLYMILQCFYVVGNAGCAIEPDSNGHVDIPSFWDTIGFEAFRGCSSLLSVTIPDSVTSIGDSAFEDCSSFVTVTIADSVITIERDAFRSCTSLSSITIPDSVTAIGADAFRKCTSLTSVTIPDGVTTIGDAAFQTCTSLTSVTIGDGVTTISELSFQGCVSLKSLEMPKSITKIKQSAFTYTGLATVTIPSSIKEIEAGAFSVMDELQSISVEASPSVLIHPHAFSMNPKLTTVTIMATKCLFFGDPIFKSPKAEFVLSRSATTVTGLPTALGFACSSDGTDEDSTRCGCQKGYENLMPENSPLFTCSACPWGFSSNVVASLGLCKICSPGHYAPNNASEICEACAKGKFGTEYFASSESTCRNCSIGKYSPAPGSEECFPCPSGSACPSEGTSEYIPCDLGTYNSYQGERQCLSCPSGTYGPSKGAAVCKDCPRGKHFSGSGADNTSYCVDCSAGRFGDKEGLANCTACPTGQYQPAHGQQQCKECIDVGKYKTNNEEHTDCVVNQDLLGKSVVELLFKSNAAYYLSFSVTLLFVAACGAMHFLRCKHENDQEYSSGGGLGNLNYGQVIIKAALPGFSFGSEIVLLIAIFSERPPLGVVMVLFRLLHLLATVFVMVALLGSKRNTDPFIGTVIPDAVNWRPAFNAAFARDNIPIVGVVFLLCACDVSLVQMLPWSNTPFYADSNGFPSKSMMRFALGVDTLQAGVSAICTIIYLASALSSNQKNPTTTGEAQTLFALNIAISLLTLTMGLVVLFLKDRLLKKNKKEPSASVTNNAHRQKPRVSAMLELGGIYEDNQEHSNAEYSNPLHSAGRGESVVRLEPATIDPGRDNGHDAIVERLARERDDANRERDELQHKYDELVMSSSVV